MATMERVTQPSGETRQPQSSSMKVAREGIGTAGSRKVVQCLRREMATMERVTQPSGETRQPQSSSMKVARERIGTAGSRKLIHSDRHRRTRLDRDMSNGRGIENHPRWPPRGLP